LQLIFHHLAPKRSPLPVAPFYEFEEIDMLQNENRFGYGGDNYFEENWGKSYRDAVCLAMTCKDAQKFFCSSGFRFQLWMTRVNALLFLAERSDYAHGLALALEENPHHPMVETDWFSDLRRGSRIFRAIRFIRIMKHDLIMRLHCPPTDQKASLPVPIRLEDYYKIIQAPVDIPAIGDPLDSLTVARGVARFSEEPTLPPSGGKYLTFVWLHHIWTRYSKFKPEVGHIIASNGTMVLALQTMAAIDVNRNDIDECCKYLNTKDLPSEWYIRRATDEDVAKFEQQEMTTSWSKYQHMGPLPGRDVEEDEEEEGVDPTIVT
jgi:hypothetical protein